MQPPSSPHPSTLPLSLIKLDEARERFGDQSVDLLIDLIYAGDLADQFGIPRTWLGHLLPLLVQVNRVQHAWKTRSPSARARTLAHVIAEYQRLLAMETGPTLYQQNAAHPDQQQLLPAVEPSAGD